MKIMRQSNLLVALILFTALIGCKEELSEEIAQDAESITSEIEKIETAYVEGAEKLENVYDGNKVETLLNGHLLDEMIKEIDDQLDNSNTKTHSYARGGGLVGVFRAKNATCGSYETLDIYMDCEDRNSETRRIGLVGDSYVDGSKNVMLKLCVVATANFERLRDVNYGLVKLTNSPTYYPIDWITRKFDNEDRNNRNRVYVNGSAHAVFYNTLRIGPNTFSRNTELNFYDFKKHNNANGLNHFPNIGIEYHVLGQFRLNAKRGLLKIDDEDSRNANWVRHYEYNSRGALSVKNSITSPLMSGTRNTKLYFSKVQ